jgi:hypothetical protein
MRWFLLPTPTWLRLQASAISKPRPATGEAGTTVGVVVGLCNLYLTHAVEEYIRVGLHTGSFNYQERSMRVAQLRSFFNVKCSLCFFGKSDSSLDTRNFLLLHPFQIVYHFNFSTHIVHLNIVYIYVHCNRYVPIKSKQHMI